MTARNWTQGNWTGHELESKPIPTPRKHRTSKRAAWSDVQRSPCHLDLSHPQPLKAKQLGLQPSGQGVVAPSSAKSAKHGHCCL